MTRYRDLPAIPFAPQPTGRFATPAIAKFSDLFISLGGEIHWTCYEHAKGSLIFAEDGRPVDLSPQGSDRFRFPKVQKFADGRWLVVEARTDETTPNASLFDVNGAFIDTFYAGDGIQSVIVDRHGGIWIGYFDEGIFGAFAFKSHSARSAALTVPTDLFGSTSKVTLNLDIITGSLIGSFPTFKR